MKIKKIHNNLRHYVFHPKTDHGQYHPAALKSTPRLLSSFLRRLYHKIVQGNKNSKNINTKEEQNKIKKKNEPQQYSTG